MPLKINQSTNQQNLNEFVGQTKTTKNHPHHHHHHDFYCTRRQGGSPRSVVASVLECDTVVTEFEFKLSHYAILSYIYIYIYHVVLLEQISLSLSLSLSLSHSLSIRLYDLSLPAGPPCYNLCPYSAVVVLVGRPTLVRPCEGVHRENVAYIFALTFLAVSRVSCSSYLDCFRDGR